jgi:hypothetical protein
VTEGVTAIAALTLRRRCRIAGTVDSVTVRHRPWLRTDVELADATGSVILRFVGRDGLPGVAPGRCVIAEGTPARVGEATVFLNPLYGFGCGAPSDASGCSG